MTRKEVQADEIVAGDVVFFTTASRTVRIKAFRVFRPTGDHTRVVGKDSNDAWHDVTVPNIRKIQVERQGAQQ